MDNIELLIDRFDDLKTDTSEIKNHLKELNGRTRTVEVIVATHDRFWKIFGAILASVVAAALGYFWP